MKIVSLGRMAHFFIPAAKWDSYRWTIKDKEDTWRTVKEMIDKFLVNNYNGYTIRGPYEGVWRKCEGCPAMKERVIEVKVAFVGKERIPTLQEFLAKLCQDIEEECLYLETGEDSWLVYPEIK